MLVKIARGVLYALSHLGIGSGLTLLTFYVVDRFNTAMAFIDHPMSKKLLLVFSVVLIVVSSVEIADIIFRRRMLPLSVLPALAVVAAVSAVCLVIVDSLEPERILFTKNAVKTVFAADAVTGLGVYISYVALRRSTKGRK